MPINKFVKGIVVGGLAAGATIGFIKSKQGKVLQRKFVNNWNELYENLNSKIDDVSTLTQEKYNALADKVVKEYGKKKDWAEDTLQTVQKDLEKRWWDFQVYHLSQELKKKIAQTDKITKAEFNELVEEVTNNYARQKELVKEKKDELIRELKHNWKALVA